MSIGNSIFIATGIVTNIETGTTKSGLEFCEIILSQEYNKFIAMRVWGNDINANNLYELKEGTVVVATGRVRSYRSERGYWNTTCTLRKIEKVSMLTDIENDESQIHGSPTENIDIPF